MDNIMNYVGLYRLHLHTASCKREKCETGQLYVNCFCLPVPAQRNTNLKTGKPLSKSTKFTNITLDRKRMRRRLLATKLSETYFLNFLLMILVFSVHITFGLCTMPVRASSSSPELQNTTSQCGCQASSTIYCLCHLRDSVLIQEKMWCHILCDIAHCLRTWDTLCSADNCTDTLPSLIHRLSSKLRALQHQSNAATSLGNFVFLGYYN